MWTELRKPKGLLYRDDGAPPVGAGKRSQPLEQPPLDTASWAST